MQTNVIRALALVAALSSTSIGPLSLHAADVPLTLQQLISAAREKNGDLNALRKEAAIGEAAREKAGLHANPVFEVEGNSAALSGNASENTFSLGLSQEFSTGGRRQKRLAAADAEMARLKSRLADAERLLLLDVNTGYFDLLLAERRLALAQQAHELNTQLLAITKERFAAGDIAEMDVNLAKVEAARSFVRKTAAERAVAPARMKLLSLIGSTPGTDVKMDLGGEPKPVEMTLPELKTLALNRRPDLLALEAEKNRSEAEVTLARAERLPNVTAGLSLSRESTEISLRGVSERDTDYLIGLKLSLPIPVFDRNRAPVMEAQAKKSSAETRLQALRQNIEREVENAHAGLAAAHEVLKIYSSEIMPQLQENLKLVQEAYKLGETGIISVIDEQKKFLEVTDGYLAAQFEKNAAEARLIAAVGIDVTDPDGGKK